VQLAGHGGPSNQTNKLFTKQKHDNTTLSTGNMIGKRHISLNYTSSVILAWKGGGAYDFSPNPNFFLTSLLRIK
jgi:hypothetical protein